MEEERGSKTQRVISYIKTIIYELFFTPCQNENFITQDRIARGGNKKFKNRSRK